MPRDEGKLAELRLVAAEFDRRVARLDLDEAQALADRADAEMRIQDLAVQRQSIGEQRLNVERVVRIFSDESAVSNGR